MIHTVTLNTAVDRTIEVPNLQIGGVLTGRTIFEQPAGKGVNVSRCLATLGVPSRATGFVGQNESAWFAASLADSPAQPHFIPVPGRTRCDTTLLDPIAHTDTHIRESGYEVSDRHYDALCADLKANARPGDLVAFCGSLPPGITAPAFAALLRLARTLECRVAADASGEALRQALQTAPFFLKPNRDELRTLLPAAAPLDSPRQVAAAARSLLDHIATLVVSLGKDGAVLISSAGAWHAQCPLPPAQVQSTVGCGDASVAGFLAGLERRLSPAECLRLAVACGAACALTPAAGLIHRADVERLLPATQLAELL